jgi:hypothetical protein
MTPPKPNNNCCLPAFEIGQTLLVGQHYRYFPNNPAPTLPVNRIEFTNLPIPPASDFTSKLDANRLSVPADA